MSTEIELKYLLQPTGKGNVSIDIAEKITQLLREQAVTFSMAKKKLVNYYLDTPELALRKLDMGLRVRGSQLVGQPEVYEQTIKTAGKVISGLHKRPEYNVDIDNDKVKLALFPDEIWQKTSANVDDLQKKLVRLFNTNFERVTWTVTLAGNVIEIAFDHGTISCDDFDKTTAIYELELELVSGDQQALLTLVKTLFSHFSMRPGHFTKAARGYALAAELVKIKNIESQDDGGRDANLLNCSPIKNSLTEEEMLLEVVPLQGHESVHDAFQRGLAFSLTKLQRKVDDYINAPSFPCLIKINELFALIRQGFWLFEQELADEQLKIKDELSYFIRQFSWLDNAKHLQELISKKGGYRKKLAHSDELITKLQLEKQQFPNSDEVVTLFYSERFNLLQLALLDILLKGAENTSKDTKEQHLQKTPLSTITKQSSFSLIEFARIKLSSALNQISDEMEDIDTLPIAQASEKYITIHGLLVRSLLTGSWFRSLFLEGNKQQEAFIYGMSWLDIKQGIGELQTLHLLQQELALLQHSEDKILTWLNAKVENLLQAMNQSRLTALNYTPYWQE